MARAAAILKNFCHWGGQQSACHTAPLPPLSAGGLPLSSLPRLQPSPLITYTAAGTPSTINPTRARTRHLSDITVLQKLKCMPLISTDGQCFSTFVTSAAAAAWFCKLYISLCSDREHSSFLGSCCHRCHSCNSPANSTGIFYDPGTMRSLLRSVGSNV